MADEVRKTSAGKPNRLKMQPKIRLLDPARPLAPHTVPSLRPGWFTNIPGQMTLDFGDG